MNAGSRTALRRAVAVVIGLLGSSPAFALACPACAGRSDGGVARALMLASFVFLPFVVAWTVWRYIRSEANTGGE